MSDSMSVSITGFKELEKKMKSMDPKLRRSALKKALTAGASVVRKEASLLAPSKTGRLRRAMYIKKMGKPNPYKEDVIFGVRHGAKMSKKDMDAFYWKFLEFGTKHIKRMSFVEKAFKNTRERALIRIKTVLAKQISLICKQPI
jgi:HK97 gp10 family phage protein